MIRHEAFISHSGLSLPWKIDCDDLTDYDMKGLAGIIASKFFFSRVHGIPSGGLRLAQALIPHCKVPTTVEEPKYPVLLVDDVLTTGGSMEEWRRRIAWDSEPVIGVVIYARGPVPNWIWPIFTVNEWTQCRGTGTG